MSNLRYTGAKTRFCHTVRVSSSYETVRHTPGYRTGNEKSSNPFVFYRPHLRFGACVISLENRLEKFCFEVIQTKKKSRWLNIWRMCCGVCVCVCVTWSELTVQYQCMLSFIDPGQPGSTLRQPQLLSSTKFHQRTGRRHMRPPEKKDLSFYSKKMWTSLHRSGFAFSPASCVSWEGCASKRALKPCDYEDNVVCHKLPPSFVFVPVSARHNSPNKKQPAKSIYRAYMLKTPGVPLHRLQLWAKR